MTLYEMWKNESKYLIINRKNNNIISVVKTDEKIESTKSTGYFGIYYMDTDLHIYYINLKKCKFVNNLLKEAYNFDYYKFNCRCRKDKIKKINEYDSMY